MERMSEGTLKILDPAMPLAPCDRLSPGCAGRVPRFTDKQLAAVELTAQVVFVLELGSRRQTQRTRDIILMLRG
jgi:hypothetical protein